jgi:hypothetical protein
LPQRKKVAEASRISSELRENQTVGHVRTERRLFPSACGNDSGDADRRDPYAILDSRMSIGEAIAESASRVAQRQECDLQNSQSSLCQSSDFGGAFV